MGGEDLVQRLTADESRSGKVVANVIYQVVGLLIHVLFANREHMSEVALDQEPRRRFRAECSARCQMLAMISAAAGSATASSRVSIKRVRSFQNRFSFIIGLQSPCTASGTIPKSITACAKSK